jgi:hypothetical protein
MIAYEFYRRVPGGEDRLLGILPERRRKPERITPEAITKWARLLVNSNMSEDFFNQNIYFNRVKWPDPIREILKIAS